MLRKKELVGGQKLGLKFSNVEFLGTEAKEKGTYSCKDSIKIIMSYYNTTGAKRALFGIAIYSAFGQYLFGSSSNPIAISKKGGKVCLSINKLPIANSSIFFTFAISSLDFRIKYDWLEKKYNIRLQNEENKENFLNFDVRWIKL